VQEFTSKDWSDKIALIDSSEELMLDYQLTELLVEVVTEPLQT